VWQKFSPTYNTVVVAWRFNRFLARESKFGVPQSKVVDYSFGTTEALPPARKPTAASKRVHTLTRQMKLQLQAQGQIAGLFASTTRGRSKKQKFMIQATDDGSNAAADPVLFCVSY
jgi:hypothetical protein